MPPKDAYPIYRGALISGQDFAHTLFGADRSSPLATSKWRKIFARKSQPNEPVCLSLIIRLIRCESPSCRHYSSIASVQGNNSQRSGVARWLSCVVELAWIVPMLCGPRRLASLLNGGPDEQSSCRFLGEILRKIKTAKPLVRS